MSKFKYKVNDDVIYLGNLYENYHNKIANIISRKTMKKFYKWYVIQFDDGFKLDVKEEWIKSTQVEL